MRSDRLSRVPEKETKLDRLTSTGLTVRVNLKSYLSVCDQISRYRRWEDIGPCGKFRRFPSGLRWKRTEFDYVHVEGKRTNRPSRRILSREVSLTRVFRKEWFR